MKYILTLLLIALLPLTGFSLTVTRGYSNSTSDNDNNADLEDAASSTSVIGSSSLVVDTVGATSSALGYRFTGQASANNGGDITQTINVSVTWTVTAEIWEAYSIGITPEFHAWMNIEDGAADESGDGVWFSNLSATLKVNGSAVGDSLDLSGGSRGAVGGNSLDRTGSQTLSGYTGNNVFQLIYTGTLTATSKAGILGNDTSDAGLWGMDGTLDSRYDNNFDNYSSSGARDADGLFVDSTVTLNAIPEPASVMMIGLGGLLIALYRRFFGRI